MKKNTKGFTLVELLVVIAIIGILASVVLASLSSQRIKAQQTRAVQSVKSDVPLAMECFMKGNTVNVPTSGGFICGSSGPTWPASADLPGCTLGGDSTKATISGCGTTITCTFDTGDCK